MIKKTATCLAAALLCFQQCMAVSLSAPQIDGDKVTFCGTAKEKSYVTLTVSKPDGEYAFVTQTGTDFKGRFIVSCIPDGDIDSELTVTVTDRTSQSAEAVFRFTGIAKKRKLIDLVKSGAYEQIYELFGSDDAVNILKWSFDGIFADMDETGRTELAKTIAGHEFAGGYETVSETDETILEIKSFFDSSLKSIYQNSVIELIKDYLKSDRFDELNEYLIKNSESLDLNTDTFEYLESGGRKAVLERVKDRISELDSCKELNTVLREEAVIRVINSTLRAEAADIIPTVLKANADILDIDYGALSADKQKKLISGLPGNDYRTVSEIKSSITNLLEGKKTDSDESIKKGSGGGKSFGVSKPAVSSGDKLDAATSKPGIEENKPVFNDMDGYGWAQEAVSYLAAAKIVNGYGGNAFNPSGNVKREEFVKMLIAALGGANNTLSVEMADVKAGQWYYPYIATAVKTGIANGISESEFGIGREITRQDMAAIVYRAMKAMGIGGDFGEPSFNDSAQISDYAYPCVGALQKEQILNGDDNNNFNPTSTATRAEAAAMVYRLMKKRSAI